MLKFKMESTKDSSIEGIKKLAHQIHMEKVSFILYFASTEFDFKQVNQVFQNEYSNVLIIGGTSQGELVEEGYSQGNLVALSIYGDDFKVEALVLDEFKRKGMLYKKKVQQKIKDLGINLNDAHMKDKFFAISLIDALSSAEEKLSMVLSEAFNEKDIHLVGASCGCLNPAECYLSYNGTIYQDAAILLFVRTNKKVVIYNENIYEPIGEKHRVTSADISKRLVKTVDGLPIEKIYAKELGISENDLNEAVFAVHPIGRVVGEKSYIASPVCMVPGEGIKFYVRVMPGSSFYFMKSENPIDKAVETQLYVQEQMSNPKIILAFSCILRHIQFSQQNLTQKMYQQLSSIAPVFGITTLGEQISLTPVNQTLTLLAIEE